jgi:hypothetical protein
MISTGFKAFGTRILTLVTKGEVAKYALRGAELKQVAGEGYGFLLSSEAAVFEITDDDIQEIFQDGYLLVSEVGLES